MEDLRNFLTVRNVAERLDISEESVRDLIKNKELKAVKVGQWRIKPDEVEKFIRDRSNL